MQLKETFSTIPQHYDKARLDYPAPLFRDIVKYARLKPIDRILEIGIGTGKATEPFAKLGNPLLANDISRSLMAVAKQNLKKYNNIKYKAGQFEIVRLPKNRFQLIYAAQAFHWIRLGSGLKKVQTLLKNEGALALFWNWYNPHKGVGNVEFRLRHKYASTRSWKSRMKSYVSIEKIIKSRHFTDHQVKKYVRVIKMSKHNFNEMQKSFSWYLILPEKRKIQALCELGKGLKKFPDPLTIPFWTELLLARKK